MFYVAPGTILHVNVLTPEYNTVRPTATAVTKYKIHIRYTIHSPLGNGRYI